MSASFARLRGALDRVGTTTPGTIVGVFAEDLTAIMNHYVEVVREAAELKAARAQPAQAVPLLSVEQIQALYDECDKKSDGGNEFMLMFARLIEQAVRAKLGVAVPQWQPISTAPKDGTPILVFHHRMVLEAWYSTQWGRFVVSETGGTNGIDPAHWMPLPPPPIVGKEGA